MASVQGLALRTYNGVNKELARHLVPQIVKFRSKDWTLQGLGRGDGAWVVPIDLIGPGSICYCVGVGADISFDVELAKRGANVFCFDPTPRSIEYMKHAEYDRERITFKPIGVWRENAELKFYAPMTSTSVNYSNSQYSRNVGVFRGGLPPIDRCHETTGPRSSGPAEARYRRILV